MVTWVALGVGVVAAVLAAHLARRWRAGSRPDPALLAWGVGLALWAVASLALAAGLRDGFAGPIYRILYLTGGVLAVPWFALGAVAHHSVDRTTSRLTGVAVAVTMALALPGVRAGDRGAVMTVVLGGLWLVLLLDGNRQRVVVGSLLLVLGWSMLAAITVLPTPFRTPLPAAGLPPTDVLPAHVVAFGRAASTVGLVVLCVGAGVATLRRVLGWAPVGRRATPGDRRPLGAAGLAGGWASLAERGLRSRAIGGLVVASGVVLAVAAPAVATFLDAGTAQVLGIGLGALVVHDGALRSAGLRGSVEVARPQPGTTRVWE